MRPIARDHGELRAGRREVAGDMHRGDPGEPRRDARAYQDDRRDLYDDVRDARKEAEVARRRDAIGAQLERLRGRFAPSDLDAKRALIVELIDLARWVVSGDARELHEDRRELRKDRRDLRNDRRP